MDTLTHGLSGALAARLLPAPNPRPAAELRQISWVGFFAAVAPDLDFVISLFANEPMTYLNHHRGITHSIIVLPLWAALLSGLFKMYWRHLDGRLLFIVCGISLAVHIMGDLITSYGTMIFAPFSDYRAALDTTFIIDPIFSAIIFCSLVASCWRPRQKFLPQVTGGVLLAYLGLQVWAHQQASAIGKAYAQHQQWNAEIQAIPQPLSPFHWKVVVIEANRYHLGYVRLVGSPTPTKINGGFFNQLASIYESPDALNWQTYNRPVSTQFTTPDVHAAWAHSAIDDFRRFARYPVHAKTTTTPIECHWFHDLQFQLPGRNNPFVFGLCQHPNQQQPVLNRLR